jgi:DNA invertase Pin-like site-specific DNA recombinase
MKSTKRVGIYARVSTKRHQDVNTQLIPLRDYAKHSGWEIRPSTLTLVSAAARPADRNSTG